MKKIILLTAFIFMCFPVFSQNVQQESLSEQLNSCFIKAAKNAMPSVVNIIIYSREQDGENYIYKKTGDATGTIISEEGLLVTNYHVVSRGNYYQIVTYNGNKYDAVKMDDKNLYLCDIKTDIALLKIGNAKGEKFASLKVSEKPLREGEWVIALGNPYGLRQSITCGIVSSTGRDNVGFADIEDFIQSDVSINPGSSGGPLISLKGELVGINTAIRTSTGGYQGISFSIPAKMVCHVVEELNTYGRVRRGWIGLLAKETISGGRVPSSTVEISSVIKNSPADRAGLQEGDIIKSADGQEITSLGKLIAVIGGLSVGSSVELEIMRGGETSSCLIPLREKEVSQKLNTGLKNIFLAYGMEFDDSAASGMPVISYVAPQSPVDVQSGDSIVSLNGREINGIDELVKVFNESGRIISSMDVSRNSIIVKIVPSKVKQQEGR